ncbi:MAG TPA: hypothetical protein VGQ62_17835, partial [Chloroflexota bacterium]|nr:hypothetical protein [Chloroflexota bacterium]
MRGDAVMSTDRRSFLKGFAVASAAALGNTMAGAGVQAQTAPAPAEPLPAVGSAKPLLSATVI